MSTTTRREAVLVRVSTNTKAALQRIATTSARSVSMECALALEQYTAQHESLTLQPSASREPQ
jgi:hypothetical protein